MAQRNFPTWRLREDTEPRPYRHKVGVEHVRGENLNIAIGTSGAQVEPVANVIVYRGGDEPCGIEVALGTSTVLKVLRRLDHVMDAFPLPSLATFGPPAVVRCWKDAAVTALHLLREGLAITGSHNRSRLLRSYISIFRGSSVTREMGTEHARAVLSDYLADYYRSEYALAPRLSDDEALDLLLS
jgi:hypothetical protein